MGGKRKDRLHPRGKADGGTSTAPHGGHSCEVQALHCDFRVGGDLS